MTRAIPGDGGEPNRLGGGEKVEIVQGIVWARSEGSWRRTQGDAKLASSF